MEYKGTRSIISCGCKVVERQRIKYLSPTFCDIEYCPLHKSAPKLRKALKYIIRELDKADIIKADSIFMEMPNRAIAKVVRC